ncbi:MAG: NUDIX domain-containing protein [Arachnia sp.]
MSTSPPASRVLNSIDRLSTWKPPSSLVELREEYLDFLRSQGAAGLRRDGGPEHLTASCFIFTPDLAHVLLCFHRKGQFWVQMGGHIEAADEDLAAAALREAREESGLHELSLVGKVLDLDRHELGSAFGQCRAHWDVGFVALSPYLSPQLSDESEEVSWFPVDALPEPTAGSVTARVSQFLAILRRLPPLTSVS